MEDQRFVLMDVLLSIQTFAYNLCPYLLLWQIQPEDPEQIVEYSPELFYTLAPLRATCSALLQVVHGYLVVEEGKSFFSLAQAYAERTSQLRMGIEDILGHFNQALYRPTAIFPHLYELRSQFRLTMPHVALRYFRWFNAVPTCLIPQWAYFALEDELFNWCGHMRFRCPILANYMWPSSALHFGGATRWPPEPLRGIAWGSVGRVIVIGHLRAAGPGNELVIPVWPPSNARTIFFRHGTLDGRILE